AESHFLRSRHGPPGPHDHHHAAARAGLRGAHRGARGGRRRSGHHHAVRGRHGALPALRLRQARPACHGRPRGGAARGARAALDDRAPVHPGRPAQAADRRRRHPHAQRLRDRPLAQALDGLRDDRDHADADAGRARGRHGPRADPHQESRRGRYDAGGLLRHHRRLHRPVRLPVRRRALLRRRRQPELPRALPGLDVRLRRVLLPDAGAVALPGVLGRPRCGDHHGAPERAGLGALQDLRGHGPHPPARPAGQRRARRLLHLPARRGTRDRLAVRHAPADGEADRGAAAAREPAPGHRL
ncbi:MAG: Heat shock protein HtpX, partial [uncultured Solirubrobacteraceae bacterium]